MEGDKGPATVFKIAEDVRLIGNDFFKNGKLDLALRKYNKSIRYLNEYPIFDKDDKDIDPSLPPKFFKLRISIQLNMTLAYLKLNRFREAIETASKVLEKSDQEGFLKADQAKALYRRALGTSGLKRYDDAIIDLEKAQELSPEDAAIKKELALAKQVKNLI